jgi:hypothetical protein
MLFLLSVKLEKRDLYVAKPQELTRSAIAIGIQLCPETSVWEFRKLTERERPFSRRNLDAWNQQLAAAPAARSGVAYPSPNCR